MSDAAEPSGKRLPMQSWELFPCYIPGDVWDTFKGATNMVAALDALLVFLLKLGLRTPSEPTQAILTSLLILRDGDDRKGRSADGMRSLFCTLEFEQWHSCCFEMLVCLARISNLEPTLFDFC